MNRIRLIAALIASSLMIVSLAWHSPRITLSIAAGSAIVIGSFELLRILVTNALSPSRSSKTVLIIAAFLKFAVLGAILWFVVVKLPIDPLAFLMGLMPIILALVIEGLIGGLSQSK